MSQHRLCDNCGIGVRNQYWMEVILHGRDDEPLHTGTAKAGRDYCVACLDAMANGKWDVLAARQVEAPTIPSESPQEPSERMNDDR